MPPPVMEKNRTRKRQGIILQRAMSKPDPTSIFVKLDHCHCCIAPLFQNVYLWRLVRVSGWFQGRGS